MQQRRIELAGGLYIEVRGGLVHLLVVAQVGHLQGKRVPGVLVDHDHVLQLEKLGDDPGDGPAQVRLGDQDFDGAVTQSLLDGNRS